MVGRGISSFIALVLAAGLAATMPAGTLIQASPPQEQQEQEELERHDVSVINIEVPLRVFRGDAFVGGLGLDDIEVYEDGKLQRVEAVYLIEKSEIAKKEEKGRSFTPDVSRHFFFIFELHEYLPKVGEAMDEFFNIVFAPGDRLYVGTPVKTYKFKSETSSGMPKEKIAEQLKSILRTDLTLGNSEYAMMMKNIRELIAMEDLDPGAKFLQYKDLVGRLQVIKQLDEPRLRAFAEFLKKVPGQKHAFVFYQKELVPLMPGLDEFALAELKKDVAFDSEKARRAFADSSISAHFLFLTAKPGRDDDMNVETMRAPRARTIEDLNTGRISPGQGETLDQSGAVYNAFNEIARATGGITDSSGNPAASFRKAASASEYYYLVYYSPKNYRADGKFRKIEVRVKARDCQVSYRAGYYAN